jgi:activator of 2-hydroxyglutaryl-CoA dehydratase
MSEEVTSNSAHPFAGVSLLVGMDVGSTTVKGVVVAAGDGRVLWRDYRRHDTRQAEMLCDFLLRMEREVGIAPGNCRIFVTGSGGQATRWLPALARALCRK